MGQAKQRGSFEQRKALARAQREIAQQAFDEWQEEVAEFRKTFKLDVGLIGGAPPSARVVVCRLDELKARLLGFDAAREKNVEDVAKSAAEVVKNALGGGGKEEDHELRGAAEDQGAAE